MGRARRMAHAGAVVAALLAAGAVAGCADPLAKGTPVEELAAAPRAEAPAAAHRPAEGLIAYYPFDGDVRDASGRGNHGKVRGKGVCFARGVTGKAIRFRGRDNPSHVVVANSESLKLGDQLTVACWVHVPEWPDRDGPGKSKGYRHQLFLGKSDDVRGFIVYAHSWTKPAVGLVSDNHTPRKVNALAYTDTLLKDWMHLAVTSDPDGVRVYLDGRLVKSASKAVDFARANRCDLTIGRQGNGYAGTLDGLIDELRLYNRALTAGQIRRLARRDG